MSKVSVIIPVYNAEKFLNRCLDSIITQTYENLEIICVNDGSTDSSLQILQEYKNKDNRIVIIDKENQGVSAARNDGIKISTGEYVNFVDADDWLEKDAIESMYKAIVENNVDVVRSTYYVNESEDKITNIADMAELENKLLLTNQENFNELVNNKLYDWKLLSHVWVLFIKKSVLLKTPLFVEGIHYAEDTIFYSELLNVSESIYFLDKPTYHYFCNDTSCTKSKEYYIRNMYSLARAYDKISQIIEQDKFEIENRKEILIKAYAQTIMGTVFFMYLSENKTEKEWIEIINEMMQDKTICFIVEKADLTAIPFHISYSFKLVRTKKYKTLLKFYKLRKIMRNIKLKIE